MNACGSSHILVGPLPGYDCASIAVLVHRFDWSYLVRASCFFLWVLGAFTLQTRTLGRLDPILGYRVDTGGLCASGNWHEELE
jgi:hypothetical protein